MSQRAADPYLYPPRGLGAGEAARYLGIGRTKFEQLVSDGRMPRPKRIDGRRIWDRVALDMAFQDLPEEETGNRIDRALGIVT